MLFVVQLNGQKLNYGVKLGLSESSFAIDYARTALPSTGFTGGPFASYSIGNYIAVEAGVNYLQKGATNWLKNDSTHSNVLIHAIDVPILATFMPLGNESKDVFPRVFIGHAISWNMASSSDNRRDSKLVKGLVNKTATDMSSIVNYFDYGVVFGFGLTFNTPDRIFTIDAGYRLGYSDVVLQKYENLSINSYFITVGVGL